MPPVMKPRTTEPNIICVDSEIEGHDEHAFVFTDITYGLPAKVRHGAYVDNGVGSHSNILKRIA